MKVWVFLDGRQQGPFELEQLLDMPVTTDTKVWYEGLPKWYPAGYLDELRPLFDGSLAARRSMQTQAEVQEEAPQEPLADEQPLQAETEAGTDAGTAAPEAPDRYEEHPLDSRPDVPCPPTYLGLTIFLAICCCSPVSLASLVFSFMTSGAYNKGNMKDARRYSEVTAWLIMISFALGFLSFLLWDIFF